MEPASLMEFVASGPLLLGQPPPVGHDPLEVPRRAIPGCLDQRGFGSGEGLRIEHLGLRQHPCARQ